MFKKIVSVIFIILFFTHSMIFINAKEETIIPDSEILLIYSDGANEETLSSVREIVKILTYQNFKVSYAPANKCSSQLNRFTKIICYNLESYPKDFLQNINNFEKQANKNDNDKQIMFIGNTCLKEYYDLTNRGNEYVVNKKQVGKLSYYFNESEYREVLAEESFFIFLKDVASYNSGKINVGHFEGYFCGSSGVITHIPLTDMSNPLIKAAFTKEVALWKWPYKGEPHIYAQYMLVNKVYPFEDPEKLLEIINLMLEHDEPFVISVMPIYANGDYPAMKRFCEVLRYAQAKGGTIIIHAPINQMVDLDKELIYEYLIRALDIYISHGIYPVALQVPSNWMFNQDTIEIMSHFKTIFTTEEDTGYLQLPKDANTNEIYKDGHQWISEAIKLDHIGTSHLRVSSTAVNISMLDHIEDIKDKIIACKRSFVPLKSLWDTEHSFWTEENILTYKNQMLVFNGEVIENVFFPSEYDDTFKYDRNILKRFSKDLTSENQKLIILVSIISFLFFFFILLARYYNRKKFLLHPDDLKEKP